MNIVTCNGINIVGFAGNICGAPSIVAPQYILADIADQGAITTTATQRFAIPADTFDQLRKTTQTKLSEQIRRFTNSLHVKIGDVFGEYGGVALAYGPAVGAFASALAFLNSSISLPLVRANTLDGPSGNEPLSSGYLKVSNIHEIYYEVRGNPAGIPIIFLHGGPGSGTSESYKTLFNLEKYLVVFFDQRGAGKSRPAGEIRENTTWDLVEDIEKLRKHLNLGKVIISGTSWGTTLGIAYAETYPDNVSAMVLCSVFMGEVGNVREVRHFIHLKLDEDEDEDYLLSNVFRQVALAINPNSRDTIDMCALLQMLLGPDRELARKMAKAWAFYEKKLSRPHTSDEEITADLEKSDILTPVTIEIHYIVNRFFLEEDQLWNNLYRIETIPVVIVHGEHDFVSPPHTAYKLHHRFQNSALIMVKEAGHSLSKDSRLRKAFIGAANDPEKHAPPIMGRFHISLLGRKKVGGKKVDTKLSKQLTVNPLHRGSPDARLTVAKGDEHWPELQKTFTWVVSNPKGRHTPIKGRMRVSLLDRPETDKK